MERLFEIMGRIAHEPKGLTASLSEEHEMLHVEQDRKKHSSDRYPADCLTFSRDDLGWELYLVRSELPDIVVKMSVSASGAEILAEIRRLLA